MSDSSAPAAPLAPPVRFSQPWQLRTYALAAALVDREVVDRNALDDERGDAALRSWLATVEHTLVGQGRVSGEELEEEIARQAAIAASRQVH